MVKRITSGRDIAGATMRDVARAVGVSQATVSYVLSGKAGSRISPSTRQRVLQVASDLHYRPNAIARAMALGRSRTIGVYQPHVGESPVSGLWAAQVLKGIGEALHSHGYHLLLYGYRESEDPPPAAFVDGRVDGVIILAPHLNDALPAALVKSRFPTAVVGGKPAACGQVIYADVDNVAGARMAVDYLAGMGHRCITHLAGPPDVPNAVDRARGFGEAMRAHGFPVGPMGQVHAGFDSTSGYTAACAALSAARKPTALFACNDLCAAGALRACADLGLSVPTDVAVVGFDDSPVCELVTPRLTSLRQPASELGKAAADMLMRVVDGQPVHIKPILLSASLLERESTKPGKAGQER